MTNYKNKYLEMKLKYINSKNKLAVGGTRSRRKYSKKSSKQSKRKSKNKSRRDSFRTLPQWMNNKHKIDFGSKEGLVIRNREFGAASQFMDDLYEINDYSISCYRLAAAIKTLLPENKIKNILRSVKTDVLPIYLHIKRFFNPIINY